MDFDGFLDTLERAENWCKNTRNAFLKGTDFHGRRQAKSFEDAKELADWLEEKAREMREYLNNRT